MRTLVRHFSDIPINVNVCLVVRGDWSGYRNYVADYELCIKFGEKTWLKKNWQPKNKPYFNSIHIGKSLQGNL